MMVRIDNHKDEANVAYLAPDLVGQIGATEFPAERGSLAVFAPPLEIRSGMLDYQSCARKIVEQADEHGIDVVIGFCWTGMLIPWILSLNPDLTGVIVDATHPAVRAEHLPVYRLLLLERFDPEIRNYLIGITREHDLACRSESTALERSEMLDFAMAIMREEIVNLVSRSKSSSEDRDLERLGDQWETAWRASFPSLFVESLPSSASNVHDILVVTSEDWESKSVDHWSDLFAGPGRAVHKTVAVGHPDIVLSQRGWGQLLDVCEL